jgi:predicted MFS family arabinose efflux permease
MRAALLAAPSAGIVCCRPRPPEAPPFVFIGMACLAFSGAMLLLAFGLPRRHAIVMATVMFTLAEPLFHSMVSTAFAGLPATSRLEMFNLRQICWTTGQALGALCGGTVFLLLHRNGHGPFYWLALGVCALALTTPLFVGRHRRRRRDGDTRLGDARQSGG